MPQRQRVTWAQLRVGTMVIVGLAILAIGIFFISGQVGIFNRRYTLKTYISQAAGLREGAQVRLTGVAVGNVKQVRISPFTDRARAVEIDMAVARDYQNDIRADSVASIETAGLLGESYVNISRGTPGQGVIPDGGVLKSSEGAEINQVVKNADDVIVNLRVLSGQLNDITGQMQSGKGLVGKLIYDQTLYNHLNRTADRLDQMVTRLDEGKGSLGKLLADETLYNTTIATIDRLNKVIDDMEHGQGSFAKFLSDPALYNNVNHITTQVNSLLDGVHQGHGTLGKLVTDPQLYEHLNETVDHFNRISTRMADGQGTLGKFSTDPTLYNNLSESSKSLRDFLTEFQKSPKKYLTLRVHLF
jgi:phospholipid/cholesterol/gamma-HCH transport system substrate-binding protein